jgi:predicted anti-sigma-YlaC factor YlaD
MHGDIGDRLEELLTADSSIVNDERLGSHLSSCPDCVRELQEMRVQARAVRALRVPEEVEPNPGFYARVLQRIEEERKDCIWAAFLSSSFSKRIAYASLTLAVVFGSYVVAHEERDGHIGSGPMVAQVSAVDGSVFGSRTEQRQAVLTNFVSQ